MKNPWQGPPLTHYESEFIRKEKINEDVPSGKLRMIFKTSNAMRASGALYIKYNFAVSESCNIKGHLEIS